MIPKIVITLALMAVQTAMTMSQKIRGPRLDSLKTTTADYGTGIPRFWGKRKFECPIIHAEDLKEVQHTSKGKGGKNTTYKYYATFATLICDHEIDAVTRIWMDDKLVYQATSAGPVSIGAAANLTVGGTMRIYLGDETQLPDPRYESWCDDRYGANSAPAYRGSAYVFFEDLPVNNFGNRIPNVTIEAVSIKTAVYPFESHVTAQSNGDAFAVGSTWMAYYGPAAIEWWDVPSRTNLGASGHGPGGIETSVDLASDGTAYAYDWRSAGLSVVVTLTVTPPLGASVATDTNSNSWGLTRVFDIGGDRVILGASPLGYNSELTFVASAQACRDFFLDDNNVVWAVTQPSGSSAHFGLLNVGVDALTDFTGLVTRSTVSQARGCFVAKTNSFFVVTDGKFYIINRATMTITSSGTAPWGSADVLPVKNPARLTFWNSEDEYSLIDGSFIRNVNGWATGQSPYRSTYDPVSDAIVMRPQFVSSLYWLYLNRVGSNGVTLQTVVDTVAGWCGLSGQDSSALSQTVLGYSVTQGTGKDMIGPLLDIHDVDCRPHDFTLQFLNRGGGPSGSIDTPDFVRGSEPRYTVTIQQDTDLPRKLTFNFADYDKEQQPNNAIAQRPFDAVDTTREETVDLSTYADTVSGAQQKADRYLRRAWNSREKIENTQTPQMLALEPGDVRTLILDGAARHARLNKLTIGQDGLKCEWIRDEAAVAALNPDTVGAPADGTSEQTISIPAATKGFILDAPLVRDADNDVNPGLYYAAAPYGGTWPGAIVYEDQSEIAEVASTAAATWGYATSALGTADPNLWDRGNSVNVSVFGTLTGATEAAINLDTSLNLVALGDLGRWEYLQFAAATLTGTNGVANLYTLSDLKRGRRGTEGNVGNHAVGDQLLLLSAAAVRKMGADALGGALNFEVQTLGRDVAAAPQIDLTYAGSTLKPYAPARVKWFFDGTDLQGTIFRRTRIGGSWSSAGGTIALGETSESYEIDIYNGVTFKRTIAVSGTNAFTYTAAMATADGITLPARPTIKAYQISSVVGRGFALAA